MKTEMIVGLMLLILGAVITVITIKIATLVHEKKVMGEMTWLSWMLLVMGRIIKIPFIIMYPIYLFNGFDFRPKAIRQKEKEKELQAEREQIIIKRTKKEQERLLKMK
ncbi:MAG: hypothetical protein LBC92_05300 [Rickettsiales bacterium]|jgi:hypothetical protein|nr:hypothetical protein [Rickettsiales bacterium]